MAESENNHSTIVPEKKHTDFPSKYKIGEDVKLEFGSCAHILGCKVKNVRFTESKVMYDILVPLGCAIPEEQKYTVIENVDSLCVIDGYIQGIDPY